MARYATCFCILSLLACSPTVFEHRTHWQRMGDFPGVDDPYARTCDLIQEDVRVFGPIDAREYWVKRTYLCPRGGP